jgi:NADH-quinone oxidoreductase subunit M
VFLISGLSGLALPGMSSFVSEFLVLTGAYAVNPTATIIATFGIVLAAVYILWLYQRMMTGVPSKEVEETVTEISKRELIAVAPLLAIMIVLGFVPQVALNVINPAVEQVQKFVGVTDPEAAVVIEGSGS